MIEPYLEDLEGRIDLGVEDELYTRWRQFTTGKYRGDLFTPRRVRIAPPSIEWPRIMINDALDQPELMALQQLSTCSQALAEGSGRLLAVRPNFGTGTLPSLFGPEPYLMEYSMDTLPTNRPLPGGKETIRRLLENGAPKIDGTIAARSIEMGRYFQDLFKDYPKLSQSIRIYHPDFQGPIDACELLWGSAMFIDILDEPDLVRAFLSLITETYLRLMQAWNQVVPLAGEFSVHWHLLHAGKIMLRNDSLMNLSPRIYAEIIAPLDQKILDALGGGAVHFCGRGDHFIHLLTSLRGVYAIQLSQPEYNDMETIFRHTVDRGIKLLDFPRPAAEEVLERGRDLHGCVHCW